MCPVDRLHEAIADTLRDLGATLRSNKNGRILVQDFRPVKDRVSNAELAQFHQLARLRELYLDGTATTNNSLKYLTGLAILTTPDLQNTAVTDEGITLLQPLPALKLLLLNGTNVTREGVSAMRKSMLSTRIVFTG